MANKSNAPKNEQGSSAYQKAGVDLVSGYEAVSRMKKHIARTHRPEVLSELGGFGGLFSLANLQMDDPILVSGTDGVGTKILLAQQSKRYHTIGIDCVAMCVNDVLAQGAFPLFFLDYLAVGKNSPQMIEEIVAGVAEGCVQAHCALIGGETAEMPDLYHAEEFDIAGFTVGAVDRQQMLLPDNVQEGDVLMGLKSSGIHSNGFSLVRKLFFKDHQWTLQDQLPSGKLLIDELLAPTKIYVEDMMPLLSKQLVQSVAHITGGGFYENLPRMLPAGLCAQVELSSWEIPEIFRIMQSLGAISTREMFHIFNMGMGLIFAIRPEDEAKVLEELPAATRIGQVIKASDEHVQLLNKGESI
ncbi:phosphoribosylformylglycinamidine cyclo-ligase [Allofustis seminis]|uniref:phosphoribosylformylglycinamidine cyclo-ligase n=1 Tax=Allofustis seminis TaxID=166939 RepID=UPI00036BB6AB|nr:phosphoribosylformylglycinamidine cyclo-ligase [Allofustis seminis]